MNHGQADDWQLDPGEVAQLREELRETLARGRAELLRKAYALAAAAALREAEPAREIAAAVHYLLDDLGTATERFCRVS